MSLAKFFRFVFLLAVFVLLTGLFFPWLRKDALSHESADLALNRGALILKKISLFFFATGGFILFRNYLSFPGKKYPFLGLLIGLAAAFLMRSIYVDSSYESLGLYNGLGFYIEWCGIILITFSSLVLLLLQFQSHPK